MIEEVDHFMKEMTRAQVMFMKDFFTALITNFTFKLMSAVFTGM
mgnify:CR=1 FL=1